MGATALLAGTVMSTGSKIAGGIQQNKADQATASYLHQEAGQSIASGIQGAIEDRRRATVVASSAQARTAASGLTTTGTTAVRNAGEIMGEGEYRARTSLYQGEDRAQELNVRASGLQSEGKSAEIAGVMGGVSSALSGGQSFYDKYGSPFSYYGSKFGSVQTPDYASDYGGTLA